MKINNSFGRIKLSGKDAARFIELMNDNKPNPLAVAAVNRARELGEKVRKGEKFTIIEVITEW